MYYHGLYPDAVSNVVHGYAEMDKHTDEEIEAIHEVKTTTNTHDALWSDEDYDEDPFFHALYHNNDAGNSVVNVHAKKQVMKVLIMRCLRNSIASSSITMSTKMT